MKIGGVHFRTGDDADIQADMNMAEILSRVLPYSPKTCYTMFFLIYLMLSYIFPTGSTNSSEGLWKTYITHSENEEPDEMVNIKKKFLCN